MNKPQNQNVLFRKLVIASGILSIILVILYVVVMTTQSIAFFTLGYWAFLGILWFPGLFLHYQRIKKLEAFETAWTVQSIYGGIGWLCSIVSATSFLFARKYDKWSAATAVVTALQAGIYGYVTRIRAASSGSMIAKIGSVLSFIGGVFVLILHCSSTFHAIALAVENFQYGSFDGTSVAIKQGFSLHMHCVGTKRNEDDPLVWFEHGLGGTHLDWSWVQKNISQYTRTCSYDHGGLGWSDIPSYPRGTEQIVQEWKSLLEATGIEDDLLIVGHSMAGYNSRVAERVLSNKVVGIILVDPVDTDDRPFCKEGTKSPENLLVLFCNLVHNSVSY
jgi:hypothetical protein